jgi:hypothetical protein
MMLGIFHRFVTGLAWANTYFYQQVSSRDEHQSTAVYHWSNYDPGGCFSPKQSPNHSELVQQKKTRPQLAPTPLYYGFRLSAMYCIHIVAFTIVYVSFCSVPLGVKISAHQ